MLQPDATAPKLREIPLPLYRAAYYPLQLGLAPYLLFPFYPKKKIM